MTDRLDVVIFGATGFTGKYTVMESVKILSKLTWGIAGRNQEKLENVLKDMGTKTETDLSKIPIIIADVNDEESLTNLASRTKVIVNCCGPYRFYGEPVIKACINAGTHHVDVSGEPAFMERMQLEYNDLAKEKGVYVISACGFDSIPADMGTIFFEKHFDGVVNSVETYLTSWIKGGYKGGAMTHYGTWESAVHALANKEELVGIRSKLFAEPLPSFEPRLKNRPVIHKSEIINGYWCLPFPAADRSVVQRSQRFMYENDKKRPVQVRTYLGIKSFIQMLGVIFVGAILTIFSKCSFGKNLLLQYPKLFSLGFFSHEGPTEDTMNNTKFSMVINGEGWPKEETLAEPTDKYTNPPTKTLTIKVSASNPGYGATCVGVLLAATTILNEHVKMPGKGGVLPPGAAFAKTNIINELSKNGYTFEVISAKEETKEE